MRKKVSLLLTIVLMTAFLAGCAGSKQQVPQSSTGDQSNQSQSPAPAPVEKKYYTFAASPATAAMYPYWVAVAKAVQTAYPELQISVSESQGSTDVSNRIRAGEADVGNGASPGDYENYSGTGTFNGNPNPEARALWYYDDKTACLFIASEDSGIATVDGFNGQKVNPGGTGTAAANIAMKVYELLNIKPNWFDAGKGDAADAYSNRQIVGIGAASMQPDSYLVQLQASRSFRILSFTDAQLDTILAGMPYLSKFVVPAGTYENINYDVQTYSFMQSAQTSSKLPQEDGYKMVTAVFDTQRSIWEVAMPVLADADLVANCLRSPIPLHAGTVQYLVEQGVDVPQNLIPPEYVSA